MKPWQNAKQFAIHANIEGFRPPWNGQMPKVRLLLSKTKIGFRRMPYREVVKKSLSGFRKALLVFGCYEILLSSAICRKSQRQRAENRRIRCRFGHCGSYPELVAAFAGAQFVFPAFESLPALVVNIQIYLSA